MSIITFSEIMTYSTLGNSTFFPPQSFSVLSCTPSSPSSRKITYDALFKDYAFVGRLLELTDRFSVRTHIGYNIRAEFAELFSDPTVNPISKFVFSKNLFSASNNFNFFIKKHYKINYNFEGTTCVVDKEKCTSYSVVLFVYRCSKTSKNIFLYVPLLEDKTCFRIIDRRKSIEYLTFPPYISRSPQDEYRLHIDEGVEEIKGGILTSLQARRIYKRQSQILEERSIQPTRQGQVLSKNILSCVLFPVSEGSSQYKKTPPLPLSAKPFVVRVTTTSLRVFWAISRPYVSQSAEGMYTLHIDGNEELLENNQLSVLQAKKVEEAYAEMASLFIKDSANFFC